jgi:hypothetical protein
VSSTAKVAAREVRAGDTTRWGPVDRVEKTDAHHVRIYFAARRAGPEAAGFAIDFPASERIEVEE